MFVEEIAAAWSLARAMKSRFVDGTAEGDRLDARENGQVQDQSKQKDSSFHCNLLHRPGLIFPSRGVYFHIAARGATGYRPPSRRAVSS